MINNLESLAFVKAMSPFSLQTGIQTYLLTIINNRYLFNVIQQELSITLALKSRIRYQIRKIKILTYR